MAELTVRLGVKDLERELKFYTALGFDVVDRTGTRARVELHETSFLLERYDEMRVSDGPLLDWDRTASQPGTGVQIYLMIDDVDEFAKRVPVGIPRPWPVRDKPWGNRELTLKTPTGYILTFAQKSSS